MEIQDSTVLHKKSNHKQKGLLKPPIPGDSVQPVVSSAHDVSSSAPVQPTQEKVNSVLSGLNSPVSSEKRPVHGRNDNLLDTCKNFGFMQVSSQRSTRPYRNVCVASIVKFWQRCLMLSSAEITHWLSGKETAVVVFYRDTQAAPGKALVDICQKAAIAGQKPTMRSIIEEAVQKTSLTVCQTDNVSERLVLKGAGLSCP